MRPDEPSDADRAFQEAWRARVVQKSKPDEPRYFTLSACLFIIAGFALAWGLALLVLSP